jgi:hypothetical protein
MLLSCTATDPLLSAPPPPSQSCVRPSRRASRWAWARLLLDDLDHLLLCDAAVSPRRCREILLRIWSKGANDLWLQGVRYGIILSQQIIFSQAKRAVQGEGAKWTLLVWLEAPPRVVHPGRGLILHGMGQSPHNFFSILVPSVRLSNSAHAPLGSVEYVHNQRKIVFLVYRLH